LRRSSGRQERDGVIGKTGVPLWEPARGNQCGSRLIGTVPVRNLKILLGQQMPEPDADSNDTARKNASRVGRLHSGQPISSEDTGSRNRTARATRALRSDRDHGAENASKRTQICHPFPSAVNLAVPCRSRRPPPRLDLLGGLPPAWRPRPRHRVDVERRSARTGIDFSVTW
jgi:hypothetical protein